MNIVNILHNYLKGKYLHVQDHFHSHMGLELSYTSMFDLDEKGSLHGAGLEYEIFKNTNLLIEVTKIFNNDKIQRNPFTAMKEFSRILFEIRYFY